MLSVLFGLLMFNNSEASSKLLLADGLISFSGLPLAFFDSILHNAFVNRPIFQIYLSIAVLDVVPKRSKGYCVANHDASAILLPLVINKSLVQTRVLVLTFAWHLMPALKSTVGYVDFMNVFAEV